MNQEVDDLTKGFTEAVVGTRDIVLTLRELVTLVAGGAGTSRLIVDYPALYSVADSTIEAGEWERPESDDESGDREWKTFFAEVVNQLFEPLERATECVGAFADLLAGEVPGPESAHFGKNFTLQVFNAANDFHTAVSTAADLFEADDSVDEFAAFDAENIESAAKFIYDRTRDEDWEQLISRAAWQYESFSNDLADDEGVRVGEHVRATVAFATGWHAAAESPPDGFSGPLTDTKTNLAALMGLTDARGIEAKLNANLWGRKVHRAKYELWFRDEKRFAELNLKQMQQGSNSIK